MTLKDKLNSQPLLIAVSSAFLPITMQKERRAWLVRHARRRWSRCQQTHKTKGEDQLWRREFSSIPPGGCRTCQHPIHRLDILSAALLKPACKGGSPMLRIDRNAILPGCTSTQHARESCPGFRRQFQHLTENFIARARTEIDQGPGGNAGCRAKMLQGLRTRVRHVSSRISARAADKRRIDGQLDLEHIDAVASMRKFLDGEPRILRLLPGKR